MRVVREGMWSMSRKARSYATTAKGNVAGTMMDYPLTMNHFFERAEKIFHDKTIVTASLAGVQRTTYGDWAVRTRRLGGVLDNLGIPAGARVGTFAWNSARHLEAWFAIPCSRRVLHTLNIRLFPDQLTYVVNHAEDEAIFVDRSLLPVQGTLAREVDTQLMHCAQSRQVLWPRVETFKTVKHIIVMDDGGGADTPLPQERSVA